jgi:hypothetical protein
VGRGTTRCRLFFFSLGQTATIGGTACEEESCGNRGQNLEKLHKNHPVAVYANNLAIFMAKNRFF